MVIHSPTIDGTLNVGGRIILIFHGPQVLFKQPIWPVLKKPFKYCLTSSYLEGGLRLYLFLPGVLSLDPILGLTLEVLPNSEPPKQRLPPYQSNYHSPKNMITWKIKLAFDTSQNCTISRTNIIRCNIKPCAVHRVRFQGLIIALADTLLISTVIRYNDTWRCMSQTGLS